MGHALGVGQHQLNPVFLIDFGGAGVVVNGHNIAVRILLFQLADHPLAHNVVGQAAEGLGAYDIAGTGVDELQHFSGEKPALAHFVAVP